MKVLVVVRKGEWGGGAEWMLWHLLDHGRSSGISWSLVFLEDGQLAADVRNLGVESRVIPAGRLREPWRGARAIRRLQTLMRAEKPDLVVSWMADAHLYAGPAAALAHIPATWYQLWVPEPTVIDRAATALPARGVIACSQTIADAQARLRPHRPVRVVHPGVELKRFDPALLPATGEARRELGLPEAGPIVGMVGRLERWKGAHVLVEAMPDVLRTHPDAHCVVVGTVHPRHPEYGEMLEGRIVELGLRDTVSLAGAQTNPEVWMAAMDVVVHASDNEPFGIVVIEGLASGKPVIAGAEGGPTEVIVPEVHGLLSPYGDAPALAKAVNRFLDNPDFAQRCAAAGRPRAEQFSAQAYAAKMLAVFREFSAG